jgi:hypothetical protein
MHSLGNTHLHVRTFDLQINRYPNIGELASVPLADRSQKTQQATWDHGLADLYARPVLSMH